MTDKTYAIVFITALGLSALALCLSWFISRDPIFAKDVLKLPRFRHRDYETVSSHAENGNGIDHNKQQECRTRAIDWMALTIGSLAKPGATEFSRYSYGDSCDGWSYFSSNCLRCLLGISIDPVSANYRASYLLTTAFVSSQFCIADRCTTSFVHWELFRLFTTFKRISSRVSF